MIYDNITISQIATVRTSQVSSMQLVSQQHSRRINSTRQAVIIATDLHILLGSSGPQQSSCK